MNNRTSRVLAIVSLFLFGIAMVVPALTFEKLCGGGYTPSGLFGEPTGTVEAWRGIHILLLGIARSLRLTSAPDGLPTCFI
ncbi:MAG: hypothetical protein IGR76_14500 [Synechococcales cyanobacterium T60_A2020_003]|nr:hypothetical protein [Synechococcales cyanobacterium T60_A2020_003]